MTNLPVIVDSSTLIGLTQISHLEVLAALYQTVIVPPAVVRETARTVPLPAWIQVRSLFQPIGPQILSAYLGAGESEVISLALELTVQWVVLDDLQARRVAASLGLPVVAVVGVLVAAKREGHIPAVRPLLDTLRNINFRISQRVYDRGLADAGET